MRKIFSIAMAAVLLMAGCVKEEISLNENGGEITLYAVEETRVAGVNYLLAADDEGDGDCYILRDISQAEDAEAVYEMVEDDEELDYLFRVFKELLEDIDLEY